MDSYVKQLEKLLAEYPLPLSAKTPEIHQFTKQAGLLQLNGVELSTKGGGKTFISRSASTNGSPVETAYFQLWKLLGIWSAYVGRQKQFILRDAFGRSIGECERKEVFPESPEPQKWRYSLTNGVGVCGVFREAAYRAFYSLSVGDLLMRSWSGEILPQPLPCHPILKSLEQQFEMTTLGWLLTTDPQLIAAAVLGVPKEQGVTTIVGSAVGGDRADAMEKASRAFLQNLGVNWEGAKNSRIPPARPPRPNSIELGRPAQRASLIRDWLRGKVPHKELRQLPKTSLNQSQFADLSQAVTGSPLYLVKAIQENSMPLTLGESPTHPVHPFIITEEEIDF